MATAGNITAVLTLNATKFNQGLESSLGAITKFQESISKFNADSNSMGRAIDTLFEHLNHLNNELKLFNNNITNLNKFSQLSTSINKMANGLKILSSETVDVEQGINTMNNIFKAWGNTLNGTEIKVKGLVVAERELASTKKTSLESQLESVNALNRNRDAVMRLISGDNQLTNAERQVAGATMQESASIEKDSMSKEKDVASTNKLSNANKTLKNSFSMLKGAVTMVGSMIAYNFVHNLAMATTETINAKSEMNGYFQMLGYTSSQVDRFNKALDKTVAKFPRLNKYALGETISSIGVEFELTTKEMEKAMPVVSMITSEYLRAGRNVNEASLAVKDILQGEFQRLSRETGVKADQLKEAGWSGDKTDVMGLLEALDKVGKSRNWDVFVTKANSLNDAVLIMQNRFSEWTADLVEEFQPSIVNAFNQIMTVTSLFSGSISKVVKWLNGDGLAQGIVKWGGLATAIGTVTTAFIHQRTGAGLVQIAQMGLKNSIVATALSLDAETVATKGSLFAMAQKISGLKAETVANIGAKNVILAKVLGLDMETVAQYNLRTALFSTILGIKAETIANKGLLASITASKTALIGFGLQLTAIISILGLLAIAFGKVAMEVMQNTEKMKAFHNLANNGDEVLSEYKDTISSVKDKMEDLKTTQSKYVKGSKEYIKVGKQVEHLDKLITDAKKNQKNVQEAINIAQDSQKAFDESKAEKRLDYERKIHQSLVDTKLTTEEVNTLSDTYLRQATEGSELLSEATQRLEQDYNSSAMGIANAVSEMENLNYSTTDIVERVRELSSANDFIIKGEIQMAEAENLTEYLSGWLTKQYGEVSITLSNFKFEMDEGDVVGAFEGVWKGVTYGIAGIFGKTPEEVKKITEEQGGWDWSFINAILPFDDIQHGILEPLYDFITQFDWVGSATEMFSIAFSQITHIDVIGMLLDALLPEGASASDGSSDHPSFMEDVSNIIGFDIQSWIDSFNADPMGTLGIELPKIDILGLIQGLLPSGDDSGGGGGFNLGQWLSDLFNIDGVVSYFTTNLSGIISSVTSTASTVGSLFSGLKSTIQGHLSSIVTNVSTGFENAKNYATTKITAMRDSVSGVITQMTDAWKKMKDSILNSAKLIYDGVKSKFDSVKTTLSDFFTKLQNPSQWGAGQRGMSRQPKPQTARKLFSGFNGGKHGAGINPYTSPNKKVKLSDLVNAVGGNKEVSVSDFLSMFSEGGFGGWSFHEQSKTHIFNKGKEWKSGSPNIKGIGTVGEGYKVARFWNGKPSFSFDEFLTVAEAIFSTIPYKFYYDSDWKGNWVSALLSGAVNCWDGANALIALAKVFGFDGYPVHTNLKDGTGHFYAVINGKTMDTTNFQHNGSWGALGGAGSPTRSRSVGNSTTQNINITITGDVYGEEDFISRVREGAREVMREEFNDPLSGVM